MTTTTEFVLDAFNCGGDKTIQELEAVALNRPAVLEPKLDGFRLICKVTDSGVEMYTRAMKRQDGKLPHIEEELMATFPAGTVLDGEIMALKVNPDGTVSNRFEDVQSVMLSKPELARQKGRTIKLQYAIFDLTYNAGADVRGMPLTARSLLLENYLEQNDERAYIDIVARFDVTEANHARLVEMGFEGSVVKFLDSEYLSGQRGKCWFKVKDQPTVDAVVLGYSDGRGKFAGQVGAVIFGQPVAGSPYEQAFMDGQLPKGVEVVLMPLPYIVRGQASGMDDGERGEMSKRRDQGDIGYVIEVAHMGLMHGDSAKLRHPQFKQFRPDKPADEVIWENGNENGGRR